MLNKARSRVKFTMTKKAAAVVAASIALSLSCLGGVGAAGISVSNATNHAASGDDVDDARVEQRETPKQKQKQKQKHLRLRGGSDDDATGDRTETEKWLDEAIASHKKSKRRLQSKCRDSKRSFDFQVNDNVVRDMTCEKLDENNRNSKLSKKCERLLTSDEIDTGRKVKDACPEVCDNRNDCREEAVELSTEDVVFETPSTAAPQTAAKKLIDNFLPVVAPVTVPSAKKGDFGAVVARRVDSPGNCPAPAGYNPDTATVVAVTNREIYIGCHSFEEYLSPDLRTVFIINKDVALEWKLDQLVQRTTCAESLGATLLMLDNFGGEMQGRKLAMDLITAEHPNTQFLMQMNCDVHALPKSHKYYRSVRDSIRKSADDFHLARCQREPHKFNCNRANVPDFPLVENLNAGDPLLRKRIFGMSFVLVEGFADDEDLVTRFHGVDGCKWQKKEGPLARPGKWGKWPWLCTGPKWENHALMFDMEKLLEVRDFYIDKPVLDGLRTYPSDTRFGPRFSEHFGLSMITHRDVPYHQDFASTDLGYLRDGALDYYPSDVDKEWIRVLSWASLGETRGPKQPYYAYNAYNHIGLPPYIGGTGIKFAARHVVSDDSPWIMRSFEGTPLSTRMGETLVDGMMNLFGYERFWDGSFTFNYRLMGNFPGNNFVMKTDKYVDGGDSWEFVQIYDPAQDEKIRLTAVARVTMEEIKEMDPAKRIVRLPRTGIVEIFRGPNHIHGKNHIHDKGVYRHEGSTPCGAEDQSVPDACGYAVSPDFDKSY